MLILKINELRRNVKRFNDFMKSKRLQESDNPINLIRNEIFNDCINKSRGDRGFYSLCVPTGGGKTLFIFRFCF